MSRHHMLLAAFVIVLAACASDRAGMTAPEEAAFTNVLPDVEIRSLNMRHVQNLAGMHGLEVAFDKDLAVQSLHHRFHTISLFPLPTAEVLADISISDGTGSVSLANKHAYLSVTGGIRAFDVSDPTDPVLVVDHTTPCGAASHTLVAGANATTGYFLSAPASTTGDCPDKIGVLAVSLSSPTSGLFSEVPAPGGTSCRQFAVHSTLNIAAALCTEGSWDVAETWDITDLYNPVVTGTRWAPVGSTWHSAAFTWDGEILMLGNDMGRNFFYDAADIGSAPLAIHDIPLRGPGPQACSGNFVPGATDPYFAVLGCGGSGLSLVSITREGSGAVVAEDGFYRGIGSAAYSAYAFNNFLYASDVNRGLDIVSRSGPRFGRNPMTREPVRINSRSVY